MDFLKGLNPQQQQAVLAVHGPILVMAGPGSGKTRVLTQRVAYLIGALGVPPHSILAVTFTNKAAREMEGRIVRLIGEKEARGLTLGTFHALCARILRREARHLPFGADFVIYDTEDQLALLRRALEDLNLDEKRYRPQAVHATISYAKNELFLPDTFPVNDYRDEIVARIYRRYQELLLANNALDFDDLLLYTVYLMEQVAEAKERYARLFEHILVDEFQDTNQAQYILVRHLSSFHRNLFVVGDIDQSIYRWRGADYRNVLRFEQDFPDAQVILLEQNYRSTQAILDVATAVIEPHPYRMAKGLFTTRGQGERVVVVEARDDLHEAQWVADTIAHMIEERRIPGNEIAVMYRTNAQSRLLEEAFLQRGMRYRLVGAQRFYGRREIKDLIAYLRVIHNPADEVSLLRILNVPPRGIGNKTVLALKAFAQRQKLSSGQALLAIAAEPESAISELFPQRAVITAARFGDLLANWRAQAAQSTPLQVLDRVIGDIDYRSYLDDGTREGQERWENVMELRRLAAEFSEAGLEAFLEQVALVSDQDTLAEDNDAPTLLTLHAAKGLEFGVVFIVGLNEGSLPHARSLDDREALYEERRLFYVGITRAKDRLYLVYSQFRNAYGYAELQAPSRFLEDIPADRVDFLPLAGERMDFSRRALSERPQDKTTSTSLPILEKRFSPGDRVRHPIWGEGMVLNSDLKDSDEIVDVFFESVGLKRLSASIGKLEMLA